MEEEDIREVELTTIAAIYPELQVDDNDPHTFSIELPVSLASPVTVRFPAATEGAPPVDPVQEQLPAVATEESHTLLYLPSLKVAISLPDGYPQQKPPKVSISTSPPWLSEQTIRELEGRVEALWEEFGRDQVVYSYIDNLQQSAEDIFGLVDDKGDLEVSLEHRIAILDYDIKAKRKAFEKETFDCGICLDPKKGSVCHQMLDCEHVFCIQCLQEFYNNAITEGSIAVIQCPEPNCAKEREDTAKASNKKKKAKTFISPSELLQIPLERDMVMRYVALKHKTELESDKNTVYCPRSWCQGAARSKKHKKPQGLEFVESSDEESEAEDIGAEGEEGKTFDANKELLAICEDCGFAFCTRCGQSWHGEFKYCIPKERKKEITEEEQASLDYLKFHTTPCPTCAAPCQKTHGCNHMRCFRCQTHFCYLCSAWLDPSNPEPRILSMIIANLRL
ncbi:RWD domain-containing protein [Hypoxylon sp. FL1284]|nr:RWD domain-containing protein [Hypoxylon sp. FL1284]